MGAPLRTEEGILCINGNGCSPEGKRPSLVAPTRLRKIANRGKRSKLEFRNRAAGILAVLFVQTWGWVKNALRAAAVGKGLRSQRKAGFLILFQPSVKPSRNPWWFKRSIKTTSNNNIKFSSQPTGFFSLLLWANLIFSQTLPDGLYLQLQLLESLCFLLEIMSNLFCRRMANSAVGVCINVRNNPIFEKQIWYKIQFNVGTFPGL